jgi:hypothetical protein
MKYPSSLYKGKLLKILYMSKYINSQNYSLYLKLVALKMWQKQSIF